MFARYVAIGGSQTEGLNDSDGRGAFIAWADRLARHLATANPDVLYANLAVRGRVTRQIHEQQLAPAIVLQPDLVTVMAGVNDLLRRDFDHTEVLGLVEDMIVQLRVAGAQVATCTFPDMSARFPLGKGLAPRIRALNEAIRKVAARDGAALVDFEPHRSATDPRQWSEDRIHANSLGHSRMAAAFAHALGLPGADESWHHALAEMPPVPMLRRFAGDARWIARYMLPSVVRHLPGRASGDGITAKRPSH